MRIMPIGQWLRDVGEAFVVAGAAAVGLDRLGVDDSRRRVGRTPLA